MSNGLERISLDRILEHPLVTIREHLIRYTLALQSIKDKDVLDIACGTGYGMYLMSFWAESVSGYDKDEKIVKGIKRDFQMKCAAFLEVRDLEKVDSLENVLVQKFDVITCFETLEHLENPENLLSLIEIYLKPNGIFYFSIPNRKDLIDKSKWHKSVFNKGELVKLMDQHFKKAKKKELWGQDQWGLSKDLNKPYIVGRIKI